MHQKYLNRVSKILIQQKISENLIQKAENLYFQKMRNFSESEIVL